MKTVDLKNIIIVLISFIGTLFFAYTWMSKNYNDIPNYNFLNNNFGQFSFTVFLTLFIYRFLKTLNKENVFLVLIIIFLISIIVILLLKNIILWPAMVVFILSIPLFLSRKYLKY